MAFLCTCISLRLVLKTELRWSRRLTLRQTKGKTLEEISIIFGDPVGFTTDGTGEGDEKQTDKHIEYGYVEK